MPPLSSRPALARLAARLDARAAADPEFRALLLDLADTLAEIAGPHHDDSGTADAAELGTVDAEVPAPAVDRADAPDGDTDGGGTDEVAEDDRLQALHAHFRGDGGTPRVPVPPAPHAALTTLAARLAVKAEAATHVADGGLPSATAALSERAERAGTVLWMLAPDAPAAGAAAYRALSAAFDATAAAATLLARTDAGDERFSAALRLAAEAQSALRTAFWALRHRDAARVFAENADEEPDQLALFDWLRETTTREHVFIERYMRRDDPAGAAEMATFRSRLAALRAGTPAARPPAPAVGRSSDPAALNAVGYHTRRLANGADPTYEWDRLGVRVEAALGSGLAPSHVGMRDLLLPVLDTLPPDHVATAGLARVLRELGRFSATREPEPDDDADDAPLSPDVAALAALLQGRTIAVFGGVPKPHVVDRLRAAFSLADVRWQETREHQSPAPFESVVAQPDVDLVLLFIRWCSHSFEDLKRYCEAHGKAYVRIPAGIHPNRIAHEVLAQVGDRLRSRA